MHVFLSLLSPLLLGKSRESECERGATILCCRCLKDREIAGKTKDNLVDLQSKLEVTSPKTYL